MDHPSKKQRPREFSEANLRKKNTSLEQLPRTDAPEEHISGAKDGNIEEEHFAYH